ncbi:MAG: radical SAM protein [Candidatus Gastranaerophilales bacterium]|nr:radical SAM protein [Candidatus Gastranaerophilales bacterium]
MAVPSAMVPVKEIAREAANMNVAEVVLLITFNGGTVTVRRETDQASVNGEIIRNPRYSPSICVTHNCNLNCVYCYQKHDASARMTFHTAKSIIDWIFEHVPDNADSVGIDFIGGEPLLEFTLLKDIYEYTSSKKRDIPYNFFATTNGTVLTDEMKSWFTAHREQFILGLSLDGASDTHNYNRSNSFDKIDTDFFLQNWPNQGVKMTLSEYSLPRLADNIKFVHSLGFKTIRGVNLAEGDFDWSDDKYIEILIPQLKELVEYYLENDNLVPNQMLNRHIRYCEAKERERRKWCGIGTGCPFFDVDGKMYPCAFITPMTFSQDEISDIISTDFSDHDAFIDEDCFNDCYIYPICPTCSGANYLKNKNFKQRDKSRCSVQKLITLFVADLQAKKIAANPKIYDDSTLYHTIEAIKKIRSLYYDEFQKYFSV